MWPRGGVVTQRAANPCTAGSSPARGLQQTKRHIFVGIWVTSAAENINGLPPPAYYDW